MYAGGDHHFQHLVCQDAVSQGLRCVQIQFYHHWCMNSDSVAIKMIALYININLLYIVAPLVSIQLKNGCCHLKNSMIEAYLAFTESKNTVFFLTEDNS